jgi:hypothetical protein
MLSDLRSSWAPDAFVVSFKLETDEGILVKKVRERRISKRLAHAWTARLRLARLQAAGAVERYGVHAVVANILETRKEVVTLVAPGAAGAGAHPAVSLIRRPPDGQVIEAPLVAELARRHAAFQGR